MNEHLSGRHAWVANEHTHTTSDLYSLGRCQLKLQRDTEVHLEQVELADIAGVNVR